MNCEDAKIGIAGQNVDPVAPTSTMPFSDLKEVQRIPTSLGDSEPLLAVAINCVLAINK